VSTTSYDAIVVGGGHNGLVCAAYLARAGRRVCVLERRELLGGACVTEEVFPGYRVSRASYVLSLLQPRVIRDLRLHEHGLRVRVCDPSWGTITAEGKPIVFWEGDPNRTRAEIAAVSAADADRYPDWARMLDRVAGVLRPLLMLEPPPGDVTRTLATAARSVGMRRSDLADTMRMMTMSVGDLLDDWFENDAMKGSFASSGVVGVWAGPRTPGTAYNLLHHSVGEVNGVVGAWGQVQGGMGGVSEAVARAARSWGADIRTSAEVARVDVVDGRVRGVTLASGEQLEAPVVASGIHPRTLVLGLVGPDHWPADVVRDVERFRTRGGAVKINMVVSELPRWHGIEGDDLQRVWRDGDFAVCPSIEHLERSWQVASMGEMPSECGYIEVLTPSAGDPTLIDEGLPGHVMSLYTQFGPPEREAWTDATRAAYADATMELLRSAAPNMTDDVVMHREVLAPPDLEDVFGLIGGNIFHGEQGLNQLGPMRPAPALARYATPIAGLYLCASGSHPGGGVTGLPGHNAARRILADEPLVERLRRRRSAVAARVQSARRTAV
jgi:phytoene dehydrogenase-like protein